MRIQDTRSYLIWTGLAFFLIVLIGYTLFESRYLILGPRVTIETPADGSAFMEPKINIVGKAENITSLFLNGRPIFIDEAGNFNEELLLQKGYTILTINAEDRFGRKTKKQLHLVRR